MRRSSHIAISVGFFLVWAIVLTNLPYLWWLFLMNFAWGLWQFHCGRQWEAWIGKARENLRETRPPHR